MAVVRKKQDDKNLKSLRELVSLGGNKQCFDCGQRGPTYVNMTIGSFVCTRCSGVVRGLTPPHRVKSISMATFTTDEIEFIKSHGNDNCAKTWLGLWDPKRTHTQEHRELMIDKYERKRYYLEPASPLKALTTQLASSHQTQQPHHQHQQQNNNTSTSSSVLRTPITLTPPISLRLTNRNNSAKLNNGQSAISQFQQQFTPDDSGLFNSTSNNMQQLAVQNNCNNNNSFSNGNNRNGLTNHTKNRLNASNLDNNNKFTPDTEFVADFGSASIFNATTTSNAASNNANFANNQTNKHVNGGRTTASATPSVPFGSQMHNGSVDNANENFADFDHNPIYNASGLPMSLSSTGTSLNSTGTFNSNSSISSTPSVDRYAALKDLDEQFREVKELTNGSPSSPPLRQPSANPFNHQQSNKNPFQAVQQNQNINGWPTDFFGGGSIANSSSINSSNTQMYSNVVMGVVGNGISQNGLNTANAGIHTNNGFIKQQQRNPFAAATVSSNNPFL